MPRPSKKTKRTPREKRGALVARRLDEEFLKRIAVDRYEAKAFDALYEELLPAAKGPFEQLELRRRCASRQFGLAEWHGRPLKELIRLFERTRELGLSSLGDECGCTELVVKVLRDHGRHAAARTLRREFLERVKRVHGEAGYMSGYLAEQLKRK